MSETETNQNPEMDMENASPEQIKQMREKALEAYEEEIPFLEKQLKYESLSADIAESRLRRETAEFRNMQLNAQIYAMQNPQEFENGPEEKQTSEPVKGERKLATN